VARSQWPTLRDDASDAGTEAPVPGPEICQRAEPASSRPPADPASLAAGCEASSHTSEPGAARDADVSHDLTLSATREAPIMLEASDRCRDIAERAGMASDTDVGRPQRRAMLSA